MLPFTDYDISFAFDDRDNARGRSYQNQGRVKDVRLEKNSTHVVALVQGTARLPYRVEVTIRRTRTSVDIESYCTCPVGYMCKHGAAALYEVIAQENRRHESRGSATGRRSADGVSEKTRRWLASLSDGAQTSNATVESRIVYLLLESPADPSRLSLTLTPAIQSKLKDEAWGKPRVHPFRHFFVRTSYDSLIGEKDATIISLAALGDTGLRNAPSTWQPPDDPALVDLLMTKVLETGRAFGDEDGLLPLHQGPDITAVLDWVLIEGGRQKPNLSLPRKSLRIVAGASPWYMDPITGQTGPLRYPLSEKAASLFMNLEALDPAEVEPVRTLLAKTHPSLPAPYRVKERKTAALRPTPRLDLVRTKSRHTEDAAPEPLAFLRFDYEGELLHPHDRTPTVQKKHKDEIILSPRATDTEDLWIKKLLESQLMFHPVIGLTLEPTPDPRGLALVPTLSSSPWFWLDFLKEAVPALRREGLDIHIADGFESEVVEPDSEDLDADLTQTGDWWFSLDLGISVGGQRVQLLPLLVAMIRSMRSLDDVERMARTNTCYAPLPDGRKVALPSARIRTILKTLVELFEDKALGKDGTLKISADLAASVLSLEGLTRKRWLGEGKLRALVEKLADFKGIEKRALPKGLKAALRPYQADGFNWLHFLGTYGLSGILADDMGLGKTVQALAYLCSLKESKKLDGPALVVMPTSLVANWQAEAERFTPALETVTLHGKDRATSFRHIKGADLVFTTYPLLTRDVAKLKDFKWSIILLDEAQAIKNPTAKMTQAACALEGRQRLCLTGTPVENHLGEAWSLFTFLMPGLLGDHKKFTRLYRTPIEKSGDDERKMLLAKRLKPFILRRLKTEVAMDLPPKTEIIRKVTLADDQRDLYEVVRSAMDERVREEIAAKGASRSQIVILDALLKLRQACCDPRLVKLMAARRVKSSAKLEELMSMLPTLIEEGRRILLFSQFTSMLDLIKPELAQAQIPFVELRGTTQDRKTPITQFQNGEVPLFLISLKAGGTGLNLTAADTVIHYDPWWNPAVENQATDRAHRIGQDKHVFVYKLIAEGTVEERILDLQVKKAGLAAALFGDKPGAAAALTSEDLQALLG